MDIENRLVVAKKEADGEKKGWKFGISRCKLLYIVWKDNKALLYSTVSYNQYPMLNHNGKSSEKEYIQIHNKYKK